MKKFEGARDFVVRELKALRTDDLKAKLLLAEENLTLTPRAKASLCVGTRLNYNELLCTPCKIPRGYAACDYSVRLCSSSLAWLRRS